MSVSDLIASLDVEEKARVKDERSKGVEGQTSANIVCQPWSHGKAKAKQNKNNKPKKSTTFKKKKINENEGCFICGFTGHWVKKCPHRKGRELQTE
jgi:hypothetical protein